MPNYTIEGKQEFPLTFQEFKNGMETGVFHHESHRAFAVCLFYYGVRRWEALRALREQFKQQGGFLFFNVGPRLKHSKETEPLPIPVNAPFLDILIRQIELTEKGERVFKFSPTTAWRIIRRVWHYPHHMRLTLITNLFEQGRTITQVKSWTGLTVAALDFYAGKVDIMNIGKTLGKSQEVK
jgi:integrase